MMQILPNPLLLYSRTVKLSNLETISKDLLHGIPLKVISFITIIIIHNSITCSELIILELIKYIMLSLFYLIIEDYVVCTTLKLILQVAYSKY